MATRCFSPPDSEAGRRSSRWPMPKSVDDRRRGRRRIAAGSPVEPAPVEQVAAHAEMGEQPAVLEDVADAPMVLGHEDAVLGVDQHLAVDGDAAAARASPGRRRCRPTCSCPSPNGPNSAGQAGSGREARADAEAAARMVDVDLEAHAAICRTPMRRASSSEPSSAQHGDRDRHQGEPHGAGIAAGDLGEGVDQRRQGLGPRPGCWRRR